MIHTSHSLTETKKSAETFVEYLKASPHNIFGFSGDLGSGKTSFTQCVANLLGVTDYVTSPTFVIQKIYSLNTEALPAGFPFKKLIHIDAYRLESARELEMLDFKSCLEDPTNLILIEWPERIIEALPAETPIIRFTFVSEHVRTIEFPAIMGL